MSTHPIPRARRAAALAAALLLSAGCATKRDVRDLRTEMRALGARQDSILAQLARQNSATQDTLRRQTNQLFEVRGDVSRQLQRILEELTELRELAGQNQRTIAALRDQIETMRRPAAEPAMGEAIVGAEPMGDPNAAQVMYEAALERYQRGSQPTTALRMLRDFVQQYPNHPNAPDARYYLADILVQQEELEDAIAAFNQIAELHPGSARVPDALYRVALLEIERGNRTRARQLLERIVESYPDSETVTLAREKLRELR